ncbi:MAG: type II secretion system protein GspM [Geminicoccaceae bacterium]
MSRRVPALGLLLAGVALVWFGIVEPWRAANRALDQRIEVAERELVELRALAALRPELARRVAALSEDAAEDDYVTGESETIALADLQDRVRATAQAHGGRTRSTSVLAPVDEAESFRRIGVQVELEIGTAGLRELLYELESGRPLLLVENLDLLVRPAADASVEEPRLAASFDLVGYMRVAAP